MSKIRLALALPVLLSVFYSCSYARAAQAEVCLQRETVAAWLSTVVPAYWIHHQFIGYPPNMEWQSSDTLVSWAQSQNAELLQDYAVSLRNVSNTLQANSAPESALLANDMLMQTFRTTADVMDLLAARVPASSSQLQIALQNVMILVGNTDIRFAELVASCGFEHYPDLSDEIRCLDVMAAYHGDWPKEYYGATIYILAAIQGARDNIDQGNYQLAREDITRIRDAAAGLVDPATPTPVVELARLSSMAMTAIANLLDIEIDSRLGIASQAAVDTADQTARDATSAMDREASAIFRPCQRLESA